MCLLPILEHIDIAEKLSKGNWLILLYHHDCPDCIKAIAEYERVARDLGGNEDRLQIALIEVPPYGRAPIGQNTPCTLARLSDRKEWFVTTPSVILLADGTTKSAWEGRAPDFEAISDSISTIQQITAKTSLLPINIPAYVLKSDQGCEANPLRQ